MNRHTIFAAISSLALVACMEEPVDAPAVEETGNEQAEAGGDMTPSSIDVVEAASANENLSTFLQVAIDGGVGETLAEAEEITIFAPIDEAFESVDGLDELRQDRQRLSSLLQRHAVPSRLLASDIPEGETQVETMSGETLTVTNNGGQISIATPGGTEAMVVEADITGDNGVVHAINTVLAD